MEQRRASWGLSAVLLALLVVLAVTVGSRAAGYSVRLHGPIPLVVGAPCPIMGTLMKNGLVLRNFSFGVEDGVGQRSFMARTDLEGRFTFTSTPVMAGRARLRFFVDPSSAAITEYLEVHKSPGSLYRSTNRPVLYLNYYRVDVCGLNNPTVTCTTVDGRIYCGVGGTTMSYCGMDSNLPDSKRISASYSALANHSVPLSDSDCFSSCYMENYMQSVENVAPCAEAFCNSLCAYEMGDLLGGIFWQLMYNLNCNYPGW